jgi:hypothetical protein
MITHVAVLATDGTLYSLPAPNRHHNVLHTFGPRLEGPAKVALRGGEQGFLVDGVTFLGRKEAKLYALETGQYMGQLQYADKHGVMRAYSGPDLFSEDLW